jgi:CRP/FNR family cyclic AMP-dependent transcriptional regulator
LTTHRRTALRLFAEDPSLLREVPPRVADRLRRSFVAETLALEQGIWNPEAERLEGVVGLLVLEGLLTRDVELAGVHGTEIVGPGDFLARGDADGHTFRRQTRFEVVLGAEIALLDARFLRLAARQPGLLSEVLRRSASRAHCLAVQLAISHMRPPAARVQLLLWHFADRWGIRQGDRTVIPLPLTHALLGRVIGAERATVSRALATLRRQRLVSHDPGGDWVLYGPRLAEEEDRRSTIRARFR